MFFYLKLVLQVPRFEELPALPRETPIEDGVGPNVSIDENLVEDFEKGVSIEDNLVEDERNVDDNLIEEVDKDSSAVEDNLKDASIEDNLIGNDEKDTFLTENDTKDATKEDQKDASEAENITPMDKKNDPPIEDNLVEGDEQVDAPVDDFYGNSFLRAGEFSPFSPLYLSYK